MSQVTAKYDPGVALNNFFIIFEYEIKLQYATISESRWKIIGSSWVGDEIDKTTSKKKGRLQSPALDSFAKNHLFKQYHFPCVDEISTYQAVEIDTR